MRDSMVVYKSFYDAIKDLDNDTRVKIYDYIFEYGLFMKEPEDLDGITKLAWTLIKPQLDANLKKYKNGKKGAKHGAKGGRPKKPQTVNEKNPLGVIDKNPIAVNKKTPNVNDNVNVNLNVNKRAYPQIENSDTKGLEEIQKEAVEIVYKYFIGIGCNNNDILVFNSDEIKESRKTDQRIGRKMAEINNTFFHWIYSQQITNLAKLQSYIKVIRRQNFESAYEYFNPAIEFINKAITNNWKNLYFDDIKK